VFSLKRSLSPAESAQLPVTSLSIVAAELQPAPGPRRTWRKRSKDMVGFPQSSGAGEQTVLLPNIMPLHRTRLLLSWRQAKDLESGKPWLRASGRNQRLQASAQRQLAGSGTQVWTLDLHPATEKST